MRMVPRFSLIVKIALIFILVLLVQVRPSAKIVSDQFSAAHFSQQNDQPGQAAAAFRAILAHEPWRKSLWEEVGRLSLAAGQPDQAVEAFLQAGPLSMNSQLELADAYMQQGNIPAAESAWRGVLTQGGLSRDQLRQVYERLVQAQRARGDQAAELNTLREWQTADPENAQVLYRYGLALSVVQPEQALPYLLDAAQKDSQYLDAVQMVRRGLGLAVNAAEPAYGWLMIGRSLGAINQWDLALRAFQQAVNAEPDYAEAWAFLGEAKYHLTATGKTELDRANQLKPDSTVVQALYALYWRRQGNPKQAVPYLEAIARQEPQEPVWQVELGNTWAEIGDLETAQGFYLKAINLSPQSAVYWQALANFSVNYQVDVRGLGLPAARKAVQLAPDDAAALDVMGWTMASLGDLTSAERFLQRALAKDAAYSLANLHLGQVYLQQNPDRAYLFLRRAADLEGESQVGKIAQRLLKRYYGASN